MWKLINQQFSTIIKVRSKEQVIFFKVSLNNYWILSENEDLGIYGTNILSEITT